MRKTEEDKNELNELIHDIYSRNEYFQEKRDLKNDDFISSEDRKKLDYLKKNKRMIL
jgi:hypothetical protein